MKKRLSFWTRLCTFSFIISIILPSTVFAIDNGHYKFNSIVGGAGNGDGQFSSPWTMAFDSNNNMYVVDSSNSRIQKFDSNGNFVLAWGGLGSAEGQLNFPNGIAIDSTDNIYVADTNNNRIQKFNTSGVFISTFGWNVGGGGVYEVCTSGCQSGVGDYGDELGKFSYPHGIAVDGAGNIFVTDNTVHLQKISANLSTITSFGWGVAGNDQFETCTSGCVGGTEGSQNGQFVGASQGVAVDSSNNVYVVDTGNNRIQKFNSNLEFVRKWGTSGTFNGMFQYPVGIGIDSHDNVFVTDTNNNRYQAFTSDGEFLYTGGVHGYQAGEFTFPLGIAFDGNNNLFVADNTNNHIQKFSPEYDFIAYESSDTSVTPSAPGTEIRGPESYKNVLTEGDHLYFISDLAEVSDGDYDTQVYKVHNEGGTHLTINWTGHGDTGETKLVYMSVWDNNAHSWQDLTSAQCATDCQFSESVTGAKYFDTDGNVWVKLKADNYVNPIEILGSTVYYNGGFVFSWKTNIPGDSQVVWDSVPHSTWNEFLSSETGNFGTASNGTLTTDHAVNGGPWYSEIYFMVRSDDGQENIATSIVNKENGSSCPYIFTNDGSQMNFITEASSAGILSLGTTREAWAANPFYRDTFYPNPYSAVRIGSEQMTPITEGDNKYYDIRSTTELNEVNYYDESKLRVIDHSSAVEVYPDYRNVDSTLHTIRKDATAPVTVVDQDGNDVKSQIQSNDNVYWQSPLTTTPSYLQMKLASGETTPAHLKLLIKKGKEGDFFGSFPQDALQYKNADGVFVNVPADYNLFRVTRPGAPAASINVSNIRGMETKVIDLSGLTIKDNEIRLVTTSNKTHWDIDWLVVDTTADEEITITDLTPYEANLHLRGTSALTLTNPSDTRMKNTIPVYNDLVRDHGQGSTLTGNATKYGDVSELLSATDDKFVIMTQGDEVSMRYSAPEEREGMERDFILETWDYHKPFIYGLGDTISPLPFNNMLRYPYHSETENYPSSPEYNSYQSTWNTRSISWVDPLIAANAGILHHSLNTDFFAITADGDPLGGEETSPETPPVTPIVTTLHGSSGFGYGGGGGQAMGQMTITTTTNATKTTNAATNSSFSRDLTKGSGGDDVRKLQSFLIAQGYRISAGLTGYFGAQTKSALALYQKDHGITPASGYFGAKTRAQIKSANL